MNHSSYVVSVNYDTDETRNVLEVICGRKADNNQKMDVTELTFNPFGENASLIDVFDQAICNVGLGVGIHKPLDTAQRGKIYVETTNPKAWNIDHIFGSTPR